MTVGGDVVGIGHTSSLIIGGNAPPVAYLGTMLLPIVRACRSDVQPPLRRKPAAPIPGEGGYTLAVQVAVVAEAMSALAEHARIQIAYPVTSVLEVSGDQTNGFRSRERPVPVPYIKNYDAIAGNQPLEWTRQFDVTNWGLLGAFANGLRIGGAIVAFNTSGVEMLESRQDLAVLWDLRVDPPYRRQGVGSTLFGRVQEWAALRGCRELKIETQNINVPACRFYQAQGCVLREVNTGVYSAFPDEVQLIWRKGLGRRMDLVDYDPSWPVLYEAERTLLAKAFGKSLKLIHHIGSTSVPGLRAKPVIDILIVVTGTATVAEFQPRVEELGYAARGELGIPGRAYFTKEAFGVRTHHVHVYTDGHENVAAHLAFRHALAGNRELAAEYVRVKDAAAQAHRFHSGDYGRAKAPFIERVIAEALGRSDRRAAPRGLAAHH
jgi:GrpB-like predicted nucleotidyltransferase (UPF0157 family)/GNAT superfamily N-acetyltransferase